MRIFNSFSLITLLTLGCAALQNACTTSTALQGRCQPHDQSCDGVSEISRKCATGQTCCAPATTNPQCAHPPRGDCSFYANCLESRYHCGPEGYPLGYGLHYCEKFQSAASKFSAKGQKWMNDVMQCLQRDLVSEAIDVGATATTSCADIKTKAFESHSGCYVQSGLCTLPLSDWLQILKVVNLKGLLGGVDNVMEVLESAGDCFKFYRWWLKAHL